MADYLRQSGAPSVTLFDIISEVRRRWRMKLALRGAVRVAAAGAGLFLLAAWGMEAARFSAESILAARATMAVALAAAVFWFLVRPLRRRVSDEQVALYLEEHEPSLEAALVSAVEALRRGTRSESDALVRRVIEQAIEACVAAGAAQRIERVPLRRYATALGGIVVAALLGMWLGPAFLRHAVSAMLLVSSDVQAAVPYRIEVRPGNASVPKGSDQTISARLLGFTSENVVLMARRAADGEFESIPLARNDDGTFEGMVFDLAAPLEYYVEAEGVRSPIYTLKVVDLPYVQRLDLEYHFPAYTGLEPQHIEDGGDIAVLRGTEVRLRITPTMKTSGGRIALNEKEWVPLQLQPDGTLTAAFKVDRDGFYRVELDAPNGERVVGSPQYTIDVLADQPPTVSFSRPGRDTSASPIEEVFIEANAEDDYGIRDLELVYSINGGPEKVVKLFAGTRRLAEVTAGHTFYLEELGVEPGDSVAYYARAMDNDAVGGAKRASSDLYFVRIRPFRKDFRQAQSAGGGGGGGGAGGGQVEALSEQQRQIISATFNIQRDRRNLTPEKLRENSKVVSLAQSRLREQVEGLLTRMNSQLVERDPAFSKIAEMLPQAVAFMKDAEAQLNAAQPEQALQPENKALQILQKAEEEYETQVSVSRQAGGGGGAGGAMQRELAELFEQELDQMVSRYETASQASQQAADREIDELLEKLKELARRQEQEAERLRRRALEGAMGGSSGAQQRALAEQVEEAARRLERLAREQQRPDLQDLARQMQEAANAMRRAAAGGTANASAQAQAALERLREAEGRLQRSLTQRAERDVQEARRSADDLARRQQEIMEMERGLPASGAGRTQAARQINERKAQLEARLGELEAHLDRAAREAARKEREASRKLAEAAAAIRDNRLRDRVRYSQPMVSRGNLQELATAEATIAAGIEEVRRRLEEAQQALGQGAPGDRREQAVDRAQRLARRLESLQERTRELAERGQRGQQGRDGQQGQQDPQGQQGQQGQRGQAGQQGQQGGDGRAGDSRGDGRASGRTADGRFGGDFTTGGVDLGGGWRGGLAWGGWWDGRYLRLTEEDIRQLRNEARQYANEARDLRALLRGADIDPRELDEILRQLRRLEDERVYKDVSELARLQTEVTERLKRFEFALRRQAQAEANAVALSGGDVGPEPYRRLIEQYFRSLGRSPR
jgi:hypothetical protein